MVLSIYGKNFSAKERDDLLTYGIIGSTSTLLKAEEKLKNKYSIDKDTELINFDYFFKSIPLIIELKKKEK